VDCDALAGRLGIDVIPVVATSRKSLDRLIEVLRNPKLPKSSGGSAGLDDEVLDGCLERLRSG
jgi:Fe2+ transport system protein B